MTNYKEELVYRAEAKIKELRANVAKLKVNAHSSKNKEIENLDKHISDLTNTVKEAGENFTESVAKKINDWIK